MTHRAWYFDDDKAKDFERAQLRLDIEKLVRESKKATKIAWHEGWEQGYVDHRDGNV